VVGRGKTPRVKRLSEFKAEGIELADMPPDLPDRLEIDDMPEAPAVDNRNPAAWLHEIEEEAGSLPLV
jgi:hypothetical protein